MIMRRLFKRIGCQVQLRVENQTRGTWGSNLYFKYNALKIFLYKWKIFDEYTLFSDHVAASCYSCSSRFTAFRRRHHCRVCGQIFCRVCCSIFVDGANLGKQSKIRSYTNLLHLTSSYDLINAIPLRSFSCCVAIIQVGLADALVTCAS